jgi:hypothetical protein
MEVMKMNNLFKEATVTVNVVTEKHIHYIMEELGCSYKLAKVYAKLDREYERLTSDMIPILKGYCNGDRVKARELAEDLSYQIIYNRVLN